MVFRKSKQPKRIEKENQEVSEPLENRQIQELRQEKERQILENRKLLEKIQILENEKQTLELRCEKTSDQAKKLETLLQDQGYQTLRGFKQVAPLLNQILGRSFILTVAEEFLYPEAEDRETLNEWIDNAKKLDGAKFYCFRDQIRSGYSFRVTYSFSSKEYQLMTQLGKRTFQQLMFPPELRSGLEVNSNNKSALYLALKERKMQSAILPEGIFGAPLLSYAFPVFDDQGILIGAVSFSNDISQIVQIGKSLGSIVDSDSDQMLRKLSNVLKDEMEFTGQASGQLKEEAVFTQKTAEYIREKGREVIEIAERLKVLALNTAIEATKVGGNGKGVGIISDQMKMISEATRKTLKEVFDKSVALYQSSRKVFDTSTRLEDSAKKMQEESRVLFKTSVKITDQKDELASLVRMSIDEIARDQQDLNDLFLLIQQNK